VRVFQLNDYQCAKIDKHRLLCKSARDHTIGHCDKYTFEPTGLGDIVTYTCRCGETLDLTESGKW
jgi:hypothetical protein